MISPCCAKPEMSALSHKKHVISESGWYEAIPITNKICLKCGSHWYGEGEGRFYTKKEWDSWINDESEQTDLFKPGE